jgi:hypothetical protein
MSIDHWISAVMEAKKLVNVLEVIGGMWKITNKQLH